MSRRRKKYIEKSRTKRQEQKHHDIKSKMNEVFYICYNYRVVEGLSDEPELRDDDDDNRKC